VNGGSMRVLLVDDEPLVRQGLRDFLSLEPDVEVVGEASDGKSAVGLIGKLAPDVVFLDVRMPGLDGFEVLKRLGPQALPVVVFVTAFEQYALQAFEAHAIDYLLKPFDRARFATSLDRARAQLDYRRVGRQSLSGLAKLVSELQNSEKYLKRFVVKERGRIFLVPIEEVDWLEAAGNYVTVHRGPKEYLIRETFTVLERQLDPHLFVRVHRSALVRLAAVSQLERLEGNDFRIVLANGQQLTLSRSYRKEFESRLGRAL